MHADQALSLQSAILKIAPTAGGTWAPSRAAVGDISISAFNMIEGGGTVIAELSICEGEFLVYSKTASFPAGVNLSGSATFRVSGALPLADLEFDTIRDAFDALRAQVHAAQVDALAKIEAARVSEALASLH